MLLGGRLLLRRLHAGCLGHSRWLLLRVGNKKLLWIVVAVVIVALGGGLGE